MQLQLIASSSTTLTLGWDPPPGVEWYLFFAAGTRVSNAPPQDKNGTVRRSIRFSKGSEPYEVVAVCRSGAGFTLDIGKWPAASQAIYPSTSRYPAESV